jgi:transposase
VIVDHTNRRVLDVLESREKDCVVKYLRQGREGGLLAGVVEVTCDMGDAYANAATEVFGAGCRVVIDRFHVMKNFQEQLTDARREIQRGLGKEEAKALKGTRWLWVKNGENLTEQERKELESLKERFPPLSAVGRAKGGLAGDLRGQGDPQCRGRAKATGGVDGRGGEAGVEGVEGVLQDVDQLDGQDRRVLRISFE